MFRKMMRQFTTRPGLLFLAVFMAAGFPAAAVNGQPGPTGEEIRAKLAAILARPEFAANRWIERFVELAVNFMAGIISRLFGRGADREIWPYLVLFVSFAAVCFILYYAGSRLFRTFSPEQSGTGDSPEDFKAVDDGSLRDRAARYADSGQFREAVRYLYLSLLLYLDRREMISFRTCKTNREYLSELKNATDYREGFAGMVAVFERKWYGMEACDGEDYRRFREAYMGMVAVRE